MQNTNKFLGWSQFLGAHPNWHELPPALAEALADGLDPAAAPLVAIPSDRFPGLLADLLNRAGKSVEPFDPAYHHRRHFHEVVSNAHAQMSVMDDPLPEAVVQATLLAGAGHDFGHQGATFRKNGPKGCPLPDLGFGVSTEQVSAILVDEILASAGLDPAMRIFITRMIWATTFGNKGISPKTNLERLLVAADVAPNDEFIHWLQKSIDTNVVEIPGNPLPRTPEEAFSFAGFLKNRTGFIEHFLRKILTPEAIKLGWDKTLDGYERAVKSVIDGSDPVMKALVVSMLAPYNFDFTA